VSFGSEGVFLYSNSETPGSTVVNILSCNFRNLYSDGNGTIARIKGVVSLLYLNKSFLLNLTGLNGGGFHISYCLNVYVEIILLMWFYFYLIL
jgi:hypothetical protein